MIDAESGKLTLVGTTISDFRLEDKPLLKIPTGNNKLTFSGNGFYYINRKSGNGAVLEIQLKKEA